MSILKKIGRIIVVTFQGVVLGVFLNFSWHFLLAEVIGWGDSAPDWYFNIQETIFMGIFLFGLIGRIIFNLRLSRYPWAMGIPLAKIWKELSRGFLKIQRDDTAH